MLKTFWKPKKIVTFVLKSGAKVSVKCDDITIERKGNELVGYKIAGMEGRQVFYCNLEEIAMILVSP